VPQLVADPPKIEENAASVMQLVGRGNQECSWARCLEVLQVSDLPLAPAAWSMRERRRRA
jgi:hypothetical protein